ncbi:hypothetical protein PR001_g20844 [Phytophthora rubi]|uniref:BZIP domain-containing protein n=2 Tax=Phytophthora rubi TaxID=129364 RepID=A0A6A3IX13_9STRA|nr:hypothetical protein PR002_g22302 [Phytophthora rubi]KAE8992803.1 hypothetical protein PR001_g20844 [Phytophthora rubi]
MIAGRARAQSSRASMVDLITFSAHNEIASVVVSHGDWMNTCVLRPPNSRQLSDDVIGGVIPRARQPERYSVAGADMYRAPVQEQRQDYIAEERPYTPRSIQSSTSTPMNRKRKNVENADRHLKRRNYEQQDDMIKEILTKQEHLRELRRQRQIRYRKKKENYANTLEVENKQLRQEVKELERSRRSFSSAIPADENVWRVATEYSRLFRFGFQSTAPSSTSATTLQPQTQQDFLRNTMTSDVVFNAGRGPEAMEKSWKRLSLWFLNVEFVLEGLQKGTEGSLEATTTTSVTITDRTLRNVFPHLSSDGSLRAKILDQRIEMRGSMRFEWDPTQCRVCCVMAQSNMLTPMLRLIGSLDGVSKVFEKALISPDFQWKLNA